MQMLARFLRAVGRGSRTRAAGRTEQLHQQLPTMVNVPGNKEAAAPLQLVRDRQGRKMCATLTTGELMACDTMDEVAFPLTRP